MLRSAVINLLGVTVCLAALAGWYFTAPAAGSGWILFVAFLGTLGTLNSIRSTPIAAISSLLITGAAGAAWFLHRDFNHAGWVLCLAILGGFRTFRAVQTLMVESNAKTAANNLTAPKEDEKKD